MTDNYRHAEEFLVEEITGNIIDACEHSRLYDFSDEWAEYVTALALHRLANAWERRVEIAEATAKQKGINP